MRAVSVNAFIIMLGIVTVSAIAQERASSDPLVSQAVYDQWLVDLSNWGRWGPDDEVGALNLITPAKRRAAAALVDEGFTVSLASTAQTEATIDNPCPVVWEMLRATATGRPAAVGRARLRVDDARDTPARPRRRRCAR